MKKVRSFERFLPFVARARKRSTPPPRRYEIRHDGPALSSPYRVRVARRGGARHLPLVTLPPDYPHSNVNIFDTIIIIIIIIRIIL